MKLQSLNLVYFKQITISFSNILIPTMASKPNRISDISEMNQKDVAKLSQIQTSISETTTQIVERDVQIIQNQTQKIEKFSEGIVSILNKTQQYHDECSKTMIALEEEVGELEEKIDAYEREYKSQNKEKEFKRSIKKYQDEYLADWKKRIELAQKLDIQKIVNLDLYDRKSKANQVFKWIIVTIYGEPESKYYWPNFKTQVFVRDQGVDLRQRLGKINASSAKEQQKIKTQDFLKNFDVIKSTPQLKDIPNELNIIKDVASIFLNCYKMAKQIRRLEDLVEVSKQKSRQKEEESMRWRARSEALKDRIKTNNQYLKILDNIKQKLQKKPEQYKTKRQFAQTALQQLKKGKQGATFTINIDNQKRDNCECTIF